jgi:hypothetical protein
LGATLTGGDIDFHSKKNEIHSKKNAEIAFKRTKRKPGTPDTDTTGVNAKRYRYVKNCILKRMVSPSINAVKNVEYGDKKMGVSTARNYLNAMVDEGLLKKLNSRYVLD